MKKITENGYCKLPNDQWLNFSMQTWIHLKEETGYDITQFGEALEKGGDLEKAVALSGIVRSAAITANLLDEVYDELPIEEVNSWFGTIIKAKELQDIIRAIVKHSTYDIIKGAKKQMGKVIPQK